MSLTSTSVDNGQRLTVAFSFYRGVAGVQLEGQGGSLACMAALPRAGGSNDGTVDGRPARLLEVRKSDTMAGMLVARFAFIDGAAA